MPKKILVLDYDGVILNSIYEKMFTGFNAYINVHGSSKLYQGKRFTFANFEELNLKEPETFSRFIELVPMIGDVGENAAAFALIEQDVRPQNITYYSQAISALGSDLRIQYNLEVKKLRLFYGEDYQDNFLKLSPPFHFVVEAIREYGKVLPIIISSAKLKENIEYFNRQLKIDKFISDIFVTDSMMSKKDILYCIVGKYNIEKKNIVFIDDFMRNLEPVIDAGFQGLLAGWGFGNSFDRAQAQSTGMKILEEKDFSEFVAKLTLAANI